MAYRYNKSLPGGYLEEEGTGNIVRDTGQLASAPPVPEPAAPVSMPEPMGSTAPVSRYTEPKEDKTTRFYESLANQAMDMPDEARRQALRTQAQRDVETQIAAINESYRRLMDIETRKQERMAAEKAGQVSGISRLSGLGGSSVASARAATQATLSEQQKAAALGLLEAQRSAEQQSALTGARREADTAYQAELQRAQQAQANYLSYLQSVGTPEQTKGVVVDGKLVNPITGEVIYAGQEQGQTYTLSPGQAVFGADGSVLAYNPPEATEEKVYTLGEGQAAFDDKGNLIAYNQGVQKRSTTVVDGRLVDTQTGEVVYDSNNIDTVVVGDNLVERGTGRVLFSAPGLSKRNTAVIDGYLVDTDTSEVIFAVPQPVGEEPKVTVINDVPSVWDSNQGRYVPAPGSEVLEDPKKAAEMKETRESIRSAALEKVNLIQSVLENKQGISDSVGLYPGGATAFNPLNWGKKVSLLSAVEQLISMDALDNLIRVKAQGATFGALSEGEMRILKAAANQLETWAERDKNGKLTGFKVGEADFKAEMKRLLDAATKLVDINSQASTEEGRGANPPGDELDSALDEAMGFRQGGSVPDNAQEAKRVANAIGQYESGGNYQARGPVVTSGRYKGERAMGKYQIMPGNLPSWSKRALGREVSEQEFMSSPEIQDAIAQHMMGRHIAAGYGVEDIASIWFSGQPLSKDRGQTDVLGTSIPSYVKAVSSIYNRMS